MAEEKTTYLRRVIIENDNGIHMDDIDFDLDFYVFTNPRQKLGKKDLIRVVYGEEVKYFAAIDSALLGRGVKGCKIMCRAAITDKEPRLDGMKRTVILKSKTGIVIGAHCCGGAEPYCECYDEGYRIKFEAVSDIPLQGSTEVMYGIINDEIGSYADITEQMAYGLTAADSLDEKELSVSAGDKVVILVNADNPDHALKGNGVGDFVPFDTSVLGANGEYKLTVDGASYRVYGEMMLVGGKLTIKL